MLVYPNAKINLGLYVKGRRNDGYHDIISLMYPIDYHDVLEIIPSGGTGAEFNSSGYKINGRVEDNLCMRAYTLLARDFSIEGTKMHLHKAIPMGAGLGGGSSDAAFTLKILNEIFNLKLTDSLLSQYASELGSDCSFFIKNEPSLATGRGEVLNKFPVELSGYTLVLVIPQIHVNTAEAYKRITPEDPEEDIAEILSDKPGTWNGRLINDFEKPVFQMFPLIRQLKAFLYLNGAVYASMSGSGSAVYGIFSINPGDLSFPSGCISRTIML